MSSHDDLDRRFAEWEARSRQWSDQEHADDCVLLDDRCCGRLWGQIRKEDPHLADLVESLYGKDWWRAVPMSVRTGLALLALRNPNLLSARARTPDLQDLFAIEVNEAVMQKLKADRARR